MDPELARLRQIIDGIDEELISLLAKRGHAVQALWEWKARHGLARLDPEREQALAGRWLERADALGLDRSAVTRVLQAVIGQALLIGSADGRSDRQNR